MKNTRKLKIKGYEYGVNQVSPVAQPNQLGNYAGIAGMAGGVIQSASGNSEAGNIIGGVGKGVAAGAAFGPVGMIAGGAIGAITGVIGNAKARKQRRLQENALETQKNVYNFNQLRGESAELQSEYYSKYGANVPTFNNGGVIGSEVALVDNNESLRTPDGNMYQVKGFNPNATDDVLANLPNGTGVLSDKLIVPGTNSTFAEAGHKLQNDMNKGKDGVGSIADTTNQLNKWAANQKYSGFLALQDDIKSAKGIANETKSYAYGTVSTNDNNPYWNSTAAQQLTPPLQNTIQPLQTNISSVPSTVNTNNVIPAYTSPITPKAPGTTNTDISRIGNSIENAVYGLSTMAPVFYNLQRGNERPEYVAPNNNPYATAATNIMARRRVDLQPMLDDNRRATAIANYNANNITGTGQNMAFRIANASAERRANADVRMRAQQINNDYRAQEADVLNNVGQQYVKEMNYADDLNRRNREKTRDFTATALTQLNEWGQMKQLSKNRKINDQQKYEIWKQLAKYGLSQADLQSIDKILK